MNTKLQQTNLKKISNNYSTRLAKWLENPFRRYSFLLIILFNGILLGGSVGMISGALSLIDPIGALITVFIIEFIIRSRSILLKNKTQKIIIYTIDFFRVGLLFGLFIEGLKLF